MNTPTPRTDAATYPADCLFDTLVTNRDCARALERELIALTAERDQLRDELERADVIYQRACEVEHELRAELAKERARLDWLESDAGVDWQWSSSALTIRRAVIDAAMKEDAK